MCRLTKEEIKEERELAKGYVSEYDKGYNEAIKNVLQTIDDGHRLNKTTGEIYFMVARMKPVQNSL